jgi:glucosamine-phosphate N-acetyltransferase
MTALVTGMIPIRECKAEDFDSIVALLGQLWPGKPLDSVSLRRVYDRTLASDQQVYLCAVCDQQVVGFGSLTIKSNLWNEAFVGYVDEMVVDGAHRGRGIGTQILDHLISWARERGCNRIELDSAFHRKDAHVFYERRGFQSRAYLYSKLL